MASSPTITATRSWLTNSFSFSGKKRGTAPFPRTWSAPVELFRQPGRPSACSWSSSTNGPDSFGNASASSAPRGSDTFTGFFRQLLCEGLGAARARGRIGGRPTVVTPDLLRAARDLLPNPEHSITSIAHLLGVSPGTLYNHIPELRELRASRPAALEGGRPSTPERVNRAGQRL
ncbi:hypothetical protein [Streptosporangium sp. NPDC003464]